jgi:hypothetical protein
MHSKNDEKWIVRQWQREWRHTDYAGYDNVTGQLHNLPMGISDRDLLTQL